MTPTSSRMTSTCTYVRSALRQIMWGYFNSVLRESNLLSDDDSQLSQYEIVFQGWSDDSYCKQKMFKFNCCYSRIEWCRHKQSLVICFWLQCSEVTAMLLTPTSHIFLIKIQQTQGTFNIIIFIQNLINTWVIHKNEY